MLAVWSVFATITSINNLARVKFLLSPLLLFSPLIQKPKRLKPLLHLRALQFNSEYIFGNALEMLRNDKCHDRHCSSFISFPACVLFHFPSYCFPVSCRLRIIALQLHTQLVTLLMNCWTIISSRRIGNSVAEIWRPVGRVKIDSTEASIKTLTSRL